MDRRRAARAAGVLLALAACFAYSAAAPTSSDLTALNVYEGSEGCYYNFQHYSEGDRIMTNEPCLNCTCHNRMLMCYLRVCPFTKPIGQDCTIEKRADQCCPIVTCPDVPVDLLTSTSTSSPAEYGPTGLGKVDKYGCSLNGKYFPEGSKVPPTPNKPCEHCYCIRNMTTCVMQECTLHVDGCTPIYHKDVCCPVRYSCDHPEDEIPLLDDMTTTVRPTPGFLLTTTTLAPVTQMTQDCVHDDKIFPDGALIKTEKACEHCYCMKGDIVCVVQECGTPMENEGKNCTALPPREGQCCPDTYICEGDEIPNEFTDITTEVSRESITPPQKLENVEGSGNEPDDSSYTDILPVTYDMEGSGEKEISISSTEMSRTPIVTEEMLTTTKKESEFVSDFTNEQPFATEETTTQPDKSLNTVPHQPDQEKIAPHSTSYTEKSEVTESGITKGTDIETIAPTSGYHMSSIPREEENVITTEKTFRKDDEGNLGMEMTTKKYFEGSTLPISSTESASALSEEQPTVTSKSPEAISEMTSSISSNEPITDTSTEGLSGSLEQITTPGRIPGEGDCLLNGITYLNNSEIPSENKCHSKCTCLSSIIRCEDIVCSAPPEFIDNCHSVYDSPDACCPTFICPQKETEPPQAHNQMAEPDTSILKPSPDCNSSDCKTKEKEPQSSECASGNCVTCADGICKSESETHKPSPLESESETPVECIQEACRRKDVVPNDKIPPQCLGSDCLENEPKSVTPESVGSTQSLETQGSPLEPVTKKSYPEISTTTEQQKYTGNYHEIAPGEYHTEYFDGSPTESPDNIYYGSETTPKEHGKENIPIISDNEKEIEMSATSLQPPATPYVTSNTVTTESEKTMTPEEFITKGPEVSVTNIEEHHTTAPQESTTKVSGEPATATESQRPSESPATVSLQPVTSAEEITGKIPEESATATESQKTIGPEESITKSPEVSVTSIEEQHSTVYQESTTKASGEAATATESQKPEVSGEPVTYASESPATASFEPVTSAEEITSRAPEELATASESQRTIAPEEYITKGPEVTVTSTEEQRATVPQGSSTNASGEPATATESQKPEVSGEPLTYASESPVTASLEPITSSEEITSKAPEEPSTAAESQKTIAPEESITKGPEVPVTSIEEQPATVPQESTIQASGEPASATESQKPEVSGEPVTFSSESPATASLEPVTSSEEITSKAPEEPVTAAESQKTIVPEESITKGPEVSVTPIEEQHATVTQESTAKASGEPATATESQKPEVSGEPLTYASESPATASLEPVTSSEEITSIAPKEPSTAAESQKTIAPEESITKGPEFSVTPIEVQHATVTQESTTQASGEPAIATESQKPEVSGEPATYASESPATASIEPVTSAEEITSKAPEEPVTAAESQKTMVPEESITKGPEVSFTSIEEEHATVAQESTTKASGEPATATESQKPEVSGETVTYASESPATASFEPATSSEEITSKGPEEPVTAAESQKTIGPEEAITKGPEVSVTSIEEQHATVPQESSTKASGEPATATESQQTEVSGVPLTYASESPATASIEPVTSAEEITNKTPEEPATDEESQKTITSEDLFTKGPEIPVSASVKPADKTQTDMGSVESMTNAPELPATLIEEQQITSAQKSTSTISAEPVTESQKSTEEDKSTKVTEVHEVVTQTESITTSDVGELKTENPVTKIESTTLATGLDSSSESILPQEEIHKEIQQPITKSPEVVMTSVDQTYQITESHSTHEPTLPEEEFIPVTTSKPTTTKVEKEFTTKPSIDKFTRPEEKATEAYATSSTPEPTEELPTPEEESPPSAPHGYGQEPDYGEDEQPFGPGTCRYGGKVYVSAQQIPRDDPCDFCFCFRSDIICLQQSCPPPIHGCHEEPIQGFCCPRYECPVAMATTLNITTTTTTTTTTLPPHFLSHAYKGAAQKKGCQIKGHAYKVGEVVRSSSGPCLHCTCGGDGQMKCDPKVCTPEPMLRQMIAAAVSAKRRR